MLIKLTSQNCAFFVKSRKILLIFLLFPPRLVWHHSSTTFPQQDDFSHPRGRGCSLCPWPVLALKLLGLWSRSCQGGLSPFQLQMRKSARQGNCEEFYSSTHRWWGQDRQELESHCSFLSQRWSIRGCRPWELQCGGQLRKRKVKKEWEKFIYVSQDNAVLHAFRSEQPTAI